MYDFNMKKVFINNVADIVDKYKNTYQSAKKIKPVDIKPSTYINFNEENSKEDPNFEVSDHARISKSKTILEKGHAPKWSEEVIVTKKLKTLCLGYMLQ